MEPRDDLTVAWFGSGSGKRPKGLPERMPDVLDPQLLAWAAGLFDGQGSSSNIHGTRLYPVLNVKQAGSFEVAPEVLLRFQRAVGGLGGIWGPYLPSGNRRPAWQYRAMGLEVVTRVVELLWPWLGEVKRTQVSRTLELARTVPIGRRRPGNTFGRPLNVYCVRGHDYGDSYVDSRGIRHCRECRRARDAKRKSD